MICSDEAYEAMLKDHATAMRVAQESIERLSKSLNASVEREKVLEDALNAISAQPTDWARGVDENLWTLREIAEEALHGVKAMREGR